MALKDKTKAELIEMIEAQREEVARARRSTSDLRLEQSKRHSAMKELRELKSRPPKVVEKPVEKIVTRTVEKPVEKIVTKYVNLDTKEADAQIKSLKEKLARAMAKLDRFESDA